MTTVRRIGSMMIASLLLAACGSAHEGADHAQPPPVEDTAFGDMVGTMDKARGVQDALEQDKQALDRALENQISGNAESVTVDL